MDANGVDGGGPTAAANPCAAGLTDAVGPDGAAARACLSTDKVLPHPPFRPPSAPLPPPCRPPSAPLPPAPPPRVHARARARAQPAAARPARVSDSDIDSDIDSDSDSDFVAHPRRALCGGRSDARMVVHPCSKMCTTILKWCTIQVGIELAAGQHYSETDTPLRHYYILVLKRI